MIAKPSTPSVQTERFVHWGGRFSDQVYCLSYFIFAWIMHFCLARRVRKGVFFWGYSNQEKRGSDIFGGKKEVGGWNKRWFAWNKTIDLHGIIVPLADNVSMGNCIGERSHQNAWLCGEFRTENKRNLFKITGAWSLSAISGTCGIKSPVIDITRWPQMFTCISPHGKSSFCTLH